MPRLLLMLSSPLSLVYGPLRELIKYECILRVSGSGILHPTLGIARQYDLLLPCFLYLLYLFTAPPLGGTKKAETHLLWASALAKCRPQQLLGVALRASNSPSTKATCGVIWGPWLTHRAVMNRSAFQPLQELDRSTKTKAKHESHARR